MAPQDTMTIFCKDRETGAKLWAFPFSKLPVTDIEGRPGDDVRGTLRFEPGDRVAYHTAYLFLAHEDPGHHPFLQAFRFQFQDAGGRNIQINDKYMGELSPQGLTPYPYDAGALAVEQYDERQPGGEILFFHHRPDASPKLVLQLLGTYTIPEVSEQNPDVRWLYQGAGLWIAEHATWGPITRLIVTSMHPRYAFGIRGLPTPRQSFVEQRMKKLGI